VTDGVVAVPDGPAADGPAADGPAADGPAADGVVTVPADSVGTEPVTGNASSDAESGGTVTATPAQPVTASSGPHPQAGPATGKPPG
jgi:hypothetical protein